MAGSGGCFSSIQQAVDAAGNGDLIEVAAGTYIENVVVGPPRRLTIQGAGPGPGVTVVDGNGAGAALDVVGTNTYLIVTGLTVQNGTPGIHVDPRARLFADDCEVTGSTPGIRAGSKGNVTVRGCDVSGNFATSPTSGGGILVLGTGSLSVSDSTIGGNSGRGIDTYALKLVDGTVSGNTGGGIRLQKGRIAGSTISGNSASTGGGIRSVQPMLLEHVTIAATRPRFVAAASISTSTRRAR